VDVVDVVLAIGIRETRTVELLDLFEDGGFTGLAGTEEEETDLVLLLGFRGWGEGG